MSNYIPHVCVPCRKWVCSSMCLYWRSSWCHSGPRSVHHSLCCTHTLSLCPICNGRHAYTHNHSNKWPKLAPVISSPPPPYKWLLLWENEVDSANRNYFKGPPPVFALQLSIWSKGRHNTIHCNTIHYNAIQYDTIQYNTIQCNAMQCKTIQYNTIQYNRVQYYSTIQPAQRKRGSGITGQKTEYTEREYWQAKAKRRYIIQNAALISPRRRNTTLSEAVCSCLCVYEVDDRHASSMGWLQQCCHMHTAWMLGGTHLAKTQSCLTRHDRQQWEGDG